ncbi:hypothetical protein HCN_0632 [Helicobacter cinaedi PAGU611]|uniref:Uncharacterized protein n=1 Tax=Helicobacter cinaedi CCUG 18818 = ATCC BAA-847 TaxID=537971 RepID=A0AAI8MMZ4_9HELI|nr:hypothetical protein [Helicobacter cinaedi]QOQ91393.1 hypothetical protein HW260_03410 [Helicobacter cinaedi]BAM11908.1 hypothetical protein HCN_0632 [Helicobacter cinaedi PAGU611]BAM32589.1 hypothetical protein HCBAA847_1359 [Helicobacter cinaedi CCUG 18818 = ATCC BAA-847]BBB19499.1 hypothetical protein HC081234_06760 [Helicobacter cinaedi]
MRKFFICVGICWLSFGIAKDLDTTSPNSTFSIIADFNEVETKLDSQKDTESQTHANQVHTSDEALQDSQNITENTEAQNPESISLESNSQEQSPALFVDSTLDSVLADSLQSVSLESQQDSKPQTQADSASLENEIFVNEGGIFPLQDKDAEILLYGNTYVLVPQSKALLSFLNQQDSKLNVRTLKSSSSTTQIYNQGKDILFYYSSKKGSSLYDKIAPKRFKLILEELSEPNKEPKEIKQVYAITQFDENILNSPCHIVQTRQFIRDRNKSEMLINLDRKINPRLLSEGKLELFLECSITENEDIFS